MAGDLPLLNNFLEPDLDGLGEKNDASSSIENTVVAAVEFDLLEENLAKLPSPVVAVVWVYIDDRLIVDVLVLL